MTGATADWGPCLRCKRKTHFDHGEQVLHCDGCGLRPRKCVCKPLFVEVLASEVAADGRLDAGYWIEKKDREVAEELRAEGFLRTEQRIEDEPWRQEFDRVIKALIRSGRTFTAEDVTDRAGRPVSQNAVGARMAKFAREGWIESVGMQRATRRSRHANRLMLWRGTKTGQVVANGA